MKKFATMALALCITWGFGLQAMAQQRIDESTPRYAAKSYGAPTPQTPLQQPQPDGSEITVMFRGDGAVHWYETPDGYTVMKNRDGFFEYAAYGSKGEVILSGIRVHNNIEREKLEQDFLSMIPQRVFYSEQEIEHMRSSYLVTEDTDGLQKSFPSTGTNKLLMILMDFTDKAHTYTSDKYEGMMNVENYNNNGSFHDFYMAMSYGKLDMVTTVSGWYTAPQPHDYYCDKCPGANNNLTYRQFVRAAVDAAEDAGVDFSEYDNDNDGKVDGIAVIHAGDGAELGNNTNIWSHSWNLGSLAATYDGVKIDAYTVNPETSYGSMGTVGVICHEFGHNLGLPDYYDADYYANGQGFDLGEWDCMAGGSYNGSPSGSRPAGHNAWSRYFLGWLELQELNTPSSITVRNLAEYPDAYIVQSGTNKEYFMVENRQKVNGTFSQYLPGHGLLIYHVDRNWSGWNNNRVNATASHQAMDIEEADHKQSGGSVSGDPFPGSANKTEFSGTTTPSMTAWNGTVLNKPITNITETGTEITFDFMGGNALEPINLSASSHAPTSIQLDWELSSSNLDVMLIAHTDENIGTPANGTAYNTGDAITGGGTVVAKGAITTFTHEGLQAGTRYYYKLVSILNNTPEYSNGAQTATATLCESIATTSYSMTFANETTSPDCWNIVDHKGFNQVWQFGSISGLSMNSTTGSDGYAFLNSIGYGAGTDQNTDMISPAFNFTGATAVTLSFEHFYLHRSGCSATLSISTDMGITWSELNQWTSTQNNITAYTVDITAQAADKSSVMFRWNYTGSKGVWAIDDITIVAENPAMSDASLSAITIDGSALEGFDSNIFSYTVALNQENPVVPVITATTTNSGAQVAITPATTIPGTTTLLVTAVDGTTQTYTVAFKNVFGMSNLSFNKVSIYPNPANNILSLTTGEEMNEATITLRDINGRVIYTLTRQKTGKGEIIPMDIHQLNRGVYILTVHTAQWSGVTRVVKQ